MLLQIAWLDALLLGQLLSVRQVAALLLTALGIFTVQAGRRR